MEKCYFCGDLKGISSARIEGRRANVEIPGNLCYWFQGIICKKCWDKLIKAISKSVDEFQKNF